MNLDLINHFVGLGGILMQIVVLFVIFSLVFKETKSKAIMFLEKYNMHIVFLMTLVATAMSLFYEYIGFAPCLLCWWQRIFIYPVIVLTGVAIWRKEKVVIPYIIPISAIGLIISVYHNLLNYIPSEGLVCGINSTVSCVENYFTVFGYMTIPMMALSLFVMTISLLGLSYIKHEHNN